VRLSSRTSKVLNALVSSKQVRSITTSETFCTDGRVLDKIRERVPDCGGTASSWRLAGIWCLVYQLSSFTCSITKSLGTIGTGFFTSQTFLLFPNQKCQCTENKNVLVLPYCRAEMYAAVSMPMGQTDRQTSHCDITLSTRSDQRNKCMA